ncbi:AGE family epimerase/isomerase [Facilibium subflavum]|uniref:AGE family epimerase/isomerase n=1 Tax=Facilibium subflavum TaxID=2219058 RepID=UPI000E64F852|nr:AGE family epimerase/isomerase [Facilibium subflavum]
MRLQQQDSQLIDSLLDNYQQLLIKNIEQYGFVPEILNAPEEVCFGKTRALCQTRGMFYLLTYGRVFSEGKGQNYAWQLYKKLKQDYFDHYHGDWKKFPNANVMNDLYEYAFLLFSFSHLYEKTNQASVLVDIKRLHQIIETKFISNDFALLYIKNDICQNAIMHLFEAYLAAYKTTQNDVFRKSAQVIYNKVIHWFYDENMQLICEYRYKRIFEPGHSFEWAALIVEASKLKIDTKGIDPLRLAHNCQIKTVLANGLVIPEIGCDQDKASYRIWPLLEQLRFYSMIKDIKSAKTCFKVVSNYYIANNLPVEYVDVTGNIQFDKVKATTGYHIINALQYYKELIAHE